MCRHFTAEHFLAAGTAVQRADITVHHEVSGDILQFFTHCITDMVQRFVTFRAMVSVRTDNFFHPWKMRPVRVCVPGVNGALFRFLQEIAGAVFPDSL